MPNKFVRSFFPVTRRQWMGFVVSVLTFLLATYLSVIFTYRQHLKELEEREWKFWSVVALESDSAIIVVDCQDGRITGWNAAATNILGWTDKEVVGSPFVFLVPDEYIRDRFGSTGRYFDRTLEPEVYENLMGHVKIINGFINTKSGKRKEVRITVRTIGGGRYFYVAAVDPTSKVEVIDAPEIATTPDKPPKHPNPMPMPIPQIK